MGKHVMKGRILIHTKYDTALVVNGSVLFEIMLLGMHSDLTGVNSAQLLFGGSKSKVDENEGL